MGENLELKDDAKANMMTFVFSEIYGEKKGYYLWAGKRIHVI